MRPEVVHKTLKLTTPRLGIGVATLAILVFGMASWAGEGSTSAAVSGWVSASADGELGEGGASLWVLESTYNHYRSLLENREPAPADRAGLSAEGFFELRAPSSGLYTVRVELPGMASIEYGPFALTEDVALPPVALAGDAETSIVQAGDEWDGIRWIKLEPGRSAPPDAPTRTVQLLVERGERPQAETVVLVNDTWPAGLTDREGLLDLVVPVRGPTPLTLIAPDGTSTRHFLDEALIESAAPIRFDLDPPKVLTCRVLDGTTGQPIDGALVWSMTEPRTWSRTTPEGACSLTGLGAQADELYASARGFSQEKAQAFSSNVAVGAETLIVLEPTATLLGEVRDTHGVAVAGAEVRSVSAPGRFPRGRGPIRAISDPHGRFSISKLELNHGFRVSVAASGYGTVSKEDVLTATGTHRTSFVLQRGCSLEAVARDVGGRPLEGVVAILLTEARPETVQVAMAGALNPADGGLIAATDATGRVSFPDLAHGAYDLILYSPDLIPRIVPEVAVGTPECDVDLGELVLDPGVALEGTVVDRDGRSIEGARVALRIRLPSGPEVTRGGVFGILPSDAAGSFRFSGLSEGQTVSLGVLAEGYLPGHLRGLVPPDRVEVELRPSGTILGEVRDENGEPIGDARVIARPQGSLTSLRTAPLVTAHGTTDANGAFEVGGVAPGVTELAVSAQGYGPGKLRDLDLREGEVVEGVRIVLSAGNTLYGRVLDARGLPVVNAYVASRGAVASSGRDGVYRLSGLRDGDVRVSVEHVEAGATTRRVHLHERETKLDLVLGDVSEVSGRVVDRDGRPLSGVTLRLHARSPMFPKQGRSAENGRFEFANVPLGAYRIVASKEGYVSRTLEIQVGNEPAPAIELPLERGGSIVGQVKGLRSDEEGTLLVEAWCAKPLSVGGRVTADGRYRVDGLEGGSCRVHVESMRSRRRAQADVTLEPGDTITADLILGSGVTLRGEVTLNAQPLPDGSVSLWDSERRFVGSASTDASGRFELDGLEDGEYLVEIRSFERDFASTEVTTIRGDTRLTVPLWSTPLSGYLLSASGGQPIEGTWVVLEPVGRLAVPRSRPRISAFSDPTGRFSFPRVLAGRYVVRVHPSGYLESSTEVEIPAQSEVGQEIRLYFDPI